jgi:hypothetical protein
MREHKEQRDAATPLNAELEDALRREVGHDVGNLLNQVWCLEQVQTRHGRIPGTSCGKGEIEGDAVDVDAPFGHPVEDSHRFSRSMPPWPPTHTALNEDVMQARGFRS